MRSRLQLRFMLWPLVLASAGCATSPYQRAGNPADVGSALARAQQPAARPSNAQQRYLGFLVLGGASGPRLAAYDLGASKTLWTQPAEVTSRIVVGPQILVHGVRAAAAPGKAGSGDDTTLVGRDIATGSVLWQYPLRAPQRSFGYAVDGDAVFVVVQTVGATQKTTTAELVALDARTGAERWRHKLPRAGWLDRRRAAASSRSRSSRSTSSCSTPRTAPSWPRCCRRRRRRRSCARFPRGCSSARGACS